MLSVQTNMLAWNAGRQFNINTKKQAKSTEKLSSGYRINRAADDAAGLSISEKMRRQIRGLMQGSDNIQEGISLVQVADGALDEVVDLLQRINELSVKAYNGTNTKEDREYIQQEITHSIKEIERIADTTTFNEIQVLKGNPKELVTITQDQICSGYYIDRIDKDIPEWLKNGIDTKLEKHNYTGLTQDTTGKMFKVDTYDADGKPLSGTYYGPNEGTLGIFQYGGSWSATLDDNPTAKISFKNLADCDDAATLYGNLVDLLGSAVGVACGTCNDQYYGIGFSGEVDGYSAYPDRYISNDKSSVEILAELNVSDWKGFTNDDGVAVNCFDKIKELVNKQEKDDTLTEDAKKAQVKSLAEEIAQKLCAETYKTMSNTPEYNGHFDRSLTDGQYDIIVYDYRDISQLSTVSASESPVVTNSKMNVKVPASYLQPGTKAWIETPLWIVCSAESGDKIPLKLPFIDAETLGIKGYDVARYTETVSYSDAYRKKLEAWENDYHIEKEVIPAHTEIRQTMVNSYSSYIDYDANGEGSFKVIVTTKITEEEVQIPESFNLKKVYNSPRPVAGDGDIIRTESYDPDSNRIIGDALEYVLYCRTMLGAQQNRLEHAYNNNQNKTENTTASESRIRDTDIAEEMVAYSNHNILLQAGTSMISQANQNAQFILQLLQ